MGFPETICLFLKAQNIGEVNLKSVSYFLQGDLLTHLLVTADRQTSWTRCMTHKSHHHRHGGVGPPCRSCSCRVQRDHRTLCPFSPVIIRCVATHHSALVCSIKIREPSLVQSGVRPLRGHFRMGDVCTSKKFLASKWLR